MALETRHHNHFSQKIITDNREFVKIDQAANFNNSVQMGFANPFATTVGNPLFGLNHQFLGSNNMMIQPQTNSMMAESGLANNLPRKRSRDSMENQFNNLNVLGNDMQSLLETDHIISQYSKKIKMEIAARQKQDARVLFASARALTMNKLKEKDDQILNMGKLNMALQERVKSLYVENQILKDVANTNEATAMTLRHNLDNFLAQVSNHAFPAAAAAEMEAESFCGSNDDGKNKHVGGGGDMAGKGRTLVGIEEVNGSGKRMCKKCGDRESCVLVMPCRHLCLCSACGATLHDTCPVCNSTMNATVHVSLT